MATFRIFLIGTSQPLLVDLPAASVAELSDLASVGRFITGMMAEPDEEGVCLGVMLQACRIQLAVEA